MNLHPIIIILGLLGVAIMIAYILVKSSEENCNWPPECFEGNCGPDDCENCPVSIAADLFKEEKDEPINKD